MNPRMAFTLVELLVVITIIVVLLAMLAPAMDKAIYEAQLTLCAANLDAHAASAHTYAFDHNRWYPLRKAVAAGKENARPDYLAMGRPNSTTYDDRPTLRGHFSLNKSFTCPFVERVDYESLKSTEPIVLSTSYAMWYGWRYNVPGEKGLNKFGPSGNSVGEYSW